MFRLLKGLEKRKKLLKAIPAGLLLSFICVALSLPALAANNGANQWGSRITWTTSQGTGGRLDTHYGQIASNAPTIPLYLDAACTQPNGSHKLYPGDWVVLYPKNADGNYAVCYPVTQPQNGGIDEGDEYTTHYIKGSYAQYIACGAGSFSGTDWDTSKWYNSLPSTISYSSVVPGNFATVYVGNNVDGGVSGGFNAIYIDNGYYELWTGNSSTRIEYSYIPGGAGYGWCYYDTNHTDITDADHAWTSLYQPWSTAGLHEGTNLVSYAGMDASGDYLTGQRSIKWDTKAPIMATNLNSPQASFTHNGWLNLADFKGNDTYIIVSQDDTSATTDVSGLNTASLQTLFDETNHFGNAAGYQGFDYNNGTNWVKSMSLSSTMQAMGVQADGTGGQGTHTFSFTSVDNAWNLDDIGASVKIDTIPPTCSTSIGSENWQSGSSPVTLTFSDSGSSDGTGSGVATEQYAWTQSQDMPSSGWQNYTDGQQLTPLSNGTWYLHWQATDYAGNSSDGTFGPYSTQPGLVVQIITPNAGYLTDSDVVTSVKVTDNSSVPILPGDNATLTFTVKNPDGSVYTTQSKSVVCPANQTNLIWFKWHTSKTAGKYTMTANVTASNATPQATWTSSLSWNISNPYENTPPDTTYEKHAPTGFTLINPPARTDMSTTSWAIWNYINGVFTKTTYHANLDAALAITPGPNTPTAFFSGGAWTMKSGYGLSEKETAALNSDEPDAVTTVQSVTSYYPEFEYETYNRNLQQTSSGVFELAPNIYSFFHSRIHFTPVWFPNGQYTTQSYAYNAWSPAGMLSLYSTGSINIQDADVNDWYPHLDN